MQDFRKRTLATVALLLLATGCGSSTSDAGRGVGRTAQTQPCPPATNRIDQSATFTWMYSADNSSFDPDNITTNNSKMYLFPIYDSLVHIGKNGDPEPMLATSWQVRDDGNVLDIKLIDGWRYHDGQPFNADSVVKNIHRSQQPGSFNANALGIVESVTAIDSTTVRFETDRAAGALIGVLGGAAGMMMSPAAMDDPSQDVQPTGGSGAFAMTNYVSGSRVEYKAVDDYWDPDAQNLSEMVFRISGDDNARLNAVLTGEVDSTFLRPSMYSSAKEFGMVVCEQPSLSSYGLTLNTKRSEFGNKKVRTALNHAIDRNAVAAVTDGFCAPGVQMFPNWYFASDERITPARFEYNPAKAKRLLQEAGLPHGFSFDLEVVNLQIYQQIAEVVQAYLADVGITMSITPVELAALEENFSVNQNVDATLAEQKADSDPSILTSQYYLRGGYNNPGGWGTEKIRALNDKAMAGATPQERKPAYRELFSAVTRQVSPQVTLCHLTTPYVMNERVKGAEIAVDAARQFRGVGMEPQSS